ncbi:epoxyqueuosine reductase [Desulfatibacillum aliphaticivorans]|uniref:epoxyqueuosine reductase n=1 Tax=Desulfatibacillum aliphaticivorans TaxID=218208 RepID=UPI00041EF34E|nr:4Fe-4S double cluster binding domain-containing protein [Desulfatibacillum aliphaticivorans]
MITKQDVMQAAYDNGFVDVGITTMEPFDNSKDYLEAHQEEYGWAEKMGLSLLQGTDPANIMPEGKSIIVLLEGYFQKSFPPSMERHFGRCYLDDDRVTKDGLALRIKAFRNFLREGGINSKVPFNLPHRAAATRAGLGTLGKNCLFYSRKAEAQSSFSFPIAVVVDREFEADEPTMRFGCPDWCRNACIAACPTKALKGNGRLDPRKCISFLSYYGRGITPLEIREAMGLFVYGCDRCQNVCPRNAPWLAKDLPVNQKAAAKAGDFELPKLLHMDKEYFETKIWPHMFYMGYKHIWRWKMNVARVMGNTLDPMYVDDLIKAFGEHDDERVLGMIAWALGRIGGEKAKQALEGFASKAQEPVLGEINHALEMID